MEWSCSLGIVYGYLIFIWFCDGKLYASSLSDSDNYSETCEKSSLEKCDKNITLKNPIRLSELIYLFPSPLKLLPVNSSNNHCAYQSKLIVKGADNLDIWALNFLDSWGKFSAGFLSGNGNQFGDFDQCIAISGEVVGKYCLAVIDVQLPKQLHSIDQLIHSHHVLVARQSDTGHRLPKFSFYQWGFCIPSVCTATDLEVALKSVYSNEMIKINASVSEELCYTSNDALPGSKLSKIFALSFFIGLLILCILGTLYDQKKISLSESSKLLGKMSTFIRPFSIPENFKTLVQRKVSPEDIPSLHGVRFLNAVALLLSHKHMALLFTPYLNRTSMALVMGQSWTVLGRTAIIYTDSFILLSGLLTTMSLLKELKKKNKIDILSNVLSRLIRLTPNLLVTMIFCTFIMPSLNSGPQWNLVVTKYAQLCNMYWWRNILYIHNLFGFEEMCLTHTHQLAIDMQLYLLSPAIVYSLWRWRKIGFLILILISFLSTVVRLIVTFNRQLTPIVYFGVEISRLISTANFSYILPTHRLTVYCVGIGMGFYLQTPRKSIVLNKFQVATGWIISACCGLAAMCGPYHMAHIGYMYNAYEASLYSALSPIIWSVFMCWLIISSTNDFAGFVGQFLHWKGFIIFTRISYAVYLTQFPIFFYNVGTKRTADYYTIFQMFNFMEFGVIILVSTVLTIMVDLPCQAMKRLLVSKVGEFQTPGPGSYSPDDSYTLKWKRAPSFSIGQRFKEERVKLGPGPNCYLLEEISGKKQSCSGFSLGIRIPDSKVPQTPGPGAYNISDLEAYKKRQPRVKMAPTTTINFLKKKKEQKLPGPNEYLPSFDTTRKNGPKFSFGRRHSMKMLIE